MDRYLYSNNNLRTFSNPTTSSKLLFNQLNFFFSTAERRELPEEAPSYVVLAFTLIMRRKMVFSTYILTLPCVFLATLTLLVFWLPPDRPDRTSLGTCSKDIKEYKECRSNSYAGLIHFFRKYIFSESISCKIHKCQLYDNFPLNVDIICNFYNFGRRLFKLINIIALILKLILRKVKC